MKVRLVWVEEWMESKELEIVNLDNYWFWRDRELWSSGWRIVGRRSRVFIKTGWKWKSLSCVWLFIVHGILQARILEWVAVLFSRGSFWLRNQTRVSCTAGRFFTDLSYQWKWTLFRPNNLLILLGFPDKWKWHLNDKNNVSLFLQFLVSFAWQYIGSPLW